MAAALHPQMCWLPPIGKVPRTTLNSYLKDTHLYSIPLTKGPRHAGFKEPYKVSEVSREKAGKSFHKLSLSLGDLREGTHTLTRGMTESW